MGKLKMNLTTTQTEEFINGYIAAMLWATNDENEDSLDSNYTAENIDSKSLNKIEVDCVLFMDQASAYMDVDTMDQHGMDFFFVRHGHGVGFSDRDIPKLNIRKLTEIANGYKETYPGAENQTIYVD